MYLQELRNEKYEQSGMKGRIYVVLLLLAAKPNVSHAQMDSGIVGNVRYYGISVHVDTAADSTQFAKYLVNNLIRGYTAGEVSITHVSFDMMHPYGIKGIVVFQDGKVSNSVSGKQMQANVGKITLDTALAQLLCSNAYFHYQVFNSAPADDGIHDDLIIKLRTVVFHIQSVTGTISGDEALVAFRNIVARHFQFEDEGTKRTFENALDSLQSAK